MDDCEIVLIKPTEPVSKPDEVKKVDFDDKIMMKSPESVSDPEEAKQVDIA